MGILMDPLIWILLITSIDGLLAFVGAFTLAIKDGFRQRLLFVLVAFSAGVMTGGALLHLLSESIEALDVDTAMLIFIVGFSAFFLVERLLHWHHCHIGKCEVHPFSYLVLYGDAIHNFIDGLLIAAAFMTSVPIGLVVSLAILGHEVPQELGNFAVTLHGGMKWKKAILYTFLVQLTAIVGGLVGYFTLADRLHFILLPFAAGGFMYIAASDLIPELHKEPKLGKAMQAFLFFVVGILLMLAFKMFTEV